VVSKKYTLIGILHELVYTFSWHFGCFQVSGKTEVCGVRLENSTGVPAAAGFRCQERETQKLYSSKGEHRKPDTRHLTPDT
jgi:hypothetical protein